MLFLMSKNVCRMRLQVLFLLVVVVTFVVVAAAVCWTTCPCEMAFAFGQRKSTVVAT